ncbi:DNA double-strand break repair nuclease NurA [Candidatus Altiarchaeota archaeon]
MRHYSLWMDKYSTRRTQIIDRLKSFGDNICDVRDRIDPTELLHDIVPAPIPDGTRMAFVDGGEGLRELMGVGIYFIRASGLLLTHGVEAEGEVFERDLDLNIIDYDRYTKDRVELLREGMEFDVALSCAKKHKPGYVFLDGSLYVKARREPIRCEEYDVYRKKFVRLMKYCKSEGIHLVGVSEDSKSRILIEHLRKSKKLDFPRYITDSSILRILAADRVYKTYTFTPKTGFEPDKQLTPGLATDFPTLFMQPTQLSNPLRIDVPGWEEDLDGIVGIIHALSEGSKGYGYPLPLYLAHLDAHIRASQTEWTARQLSSYVSKNYPVIGNAIMRNTRRLKRPE